MAGPNLTTQDFFHGVDFTALVQATAGDHNNLLDLGSPKDDGLGFGKGLIVLTIDTALDTPFVPGATVTLKWKRYAWVRVPYIDSASKTPQIYAWNDNADNDPVFLKWLPLIPNTDAFNDVILDLQNQIEQAQASATAALATANAANTTATNASVSAAESKALANAAKSAADSATANSLSVKAALDAANGTITDSVNKSAAALAAATNQKDIINLNVPAGDGHYGERIRVNNAGASLEFYNEYSNYCRVVEKYAAGTHGGASAASVIRQLNTVKEGTLVQLQAGGKIKFVATGIYRFDVTVIGAGITTHQACLVRDADNADILVGTSGYSTGDFNTFSVIKGCVTINANEVYRIDHQFSAILAHGLGIASNLGNEETYVVVEITRIK